jgi:WG containing repeat
MKMLAKLLVASFMACLLSVGVFAQIIVVQNIGPNSRVLNESVLVSPLGKVLRPLKTREQEYITFSEGIGVFHYRKDAKVYPKDFMHIRDQFIFSILLNEKGTQIIPTVFKAEVGRFSDGWARIDYKPMTVHVPGYEITQMGYIDKTGKVVLKPTAGVSGDFVNGVTFKKDVTKQKYGLINKTGNWILKPTYDEIDDFSDGLARVLFRFEGAVTPKFYGYIDATGKIVIPVEIDAMKEDCGSFVGGYAICSDYDHTKYYFIDKKRKVITKQYDAVGQFSEGIAMVANHNKDGKLEWSAIDATGKEVFAKKIYTTLKDAVIYPNSMVFKNGLCPTSEGYINNKGEVVLQFPGFDVIDAGPFENGYASFKMSPKTGPKQDTYRFTLIKTAGKIIWQSIENEKPE